MSNFRSSFHTELSQLFYYDILYRRSNYFFLLGKTDSWGEIDTPPELPVDCLEQDNIVRSNMVYAKRITPPDVSLVCNNWEWKLGLTFDKWDHTKDMKNSMFFCITSDYRVYKCLDNNNGSESSVEPTGTSIAPVRLEDGYLWKYMYTIPSIKRNRFITPSHIPVQQALTDNYYNRGELEAAIVIEQGSGFIDTISSTITVTDSGAVTGSGAAGTVVLGPNINEITNVTLTNSGTGYTKGVLIDINAATGSGAVLIPVIEYITTLNSTTTLNAGDILVSAESEYTITNKSGNVITMINNYENVTNKVLGVPVAGQIFTKKGTVETFTCDEITEGVVVDVEIVSAGIGYSSVNITFRVGGAQLLPKINVDGSLTGVIIRDPGIGYVTAPQLFLVSSSGAPTGKYGNPNAVLNAVVYRGQIQNISIVDPGQGYARDTTTIISVAGDGEGASLTPVVYQGKLIDVILENPGSGYTFTIVKVIDTTAQGVDRGAVVRTIIESSDYESDQSIIEQTAVQGAIYAIEIVNGGNGYSNLDDNTTITIVGDGTGATAVPIVVGGVITAVDVTSFGSGYTYAEVVVTDSTGSGVGANLYAILPPTGGHGFDAVHELYGDTIIMVASLRNEVISQVISGQDYRQFGLIRNPKDQFSFANFIGEQSLLLYSAVFTTTDNLTIDEILVQGTTKFSVIHIDGTTVYLSKLTQSGSLLTGPTNLLIAEIEPSREYNCSVVTSTPNMNKYSGELVYMSNEGPFVFSETQGLLIKSLVKF